MAREGRDVKLTEAQERIVAATPAHLMADINWRVGKNQHVVLDFVIDSLKSARDDDAIYSPGSIEGMGVYAHMLLCGFIERRCGANEKGPWYITPAGRLAISADNGGDSTPQAAQGE